MARLAARAARAASYLRYLSSSPTASSPQPRAHRLAAAAPTSAPSVSTKQHLFRDTTLKFILKLDLHHDKGKRKAMKTVFILAERLSPPYVDDGLIDVVGFQNIFHGLVLFTSKGHGTRLAQVEFLCIWSSLEHTKLELRGSCADRCANVANWSSLDHIKLEQRRSSVGRCLTWFAKLQLINLHRALTQEKSGSSSRKMQLITHMRIDGEPWKQPLPMDDDSVVIEISHCGRVSMLANPPCPSKSINAPPSSYVPDEDDDDSNEDLEENSEERSKLDAAETLRLPEGFDDITHQTNAG
ncbi:hypothetical protein RJ640_029748 [Escallonia rubra]|uniref:Uncharacterized protein n=1 Tax=Escallonia rubra TaxID=112253 RepID=A0AA88QUG2_9ASTE|nr:hypothetical protein RJ640_029748 [Escallonia rubra]